MNFQVVTLNQQGGRAYNEDYCGSVTLDEHLNCWVVADGLGGHGGGDVASKLAVDAILNTLAVQPELGIAALNLQFNAAQLAILEGQKQSLSLGHMQTTAVILVTHHDLALWGHVGDTRLYYFHNGVIQQQTSDHSVPQMLVKAGEINLAEIRFHEDRNRLIRSIGGEEIVKPAIEKTPIALHPGDAFLLCTDGFWEYVFEAEMEDDLKQAATTEQWLHLMEQRLLARAPKGNDNYSATAIRVM
jgi:serine/threonine protein phosphatase PrpC